MSPDDRANILNALRNRKVGPAQKMRPGIGGGSQGVGGPVAGIRPPPPHGAPRGIGGGLGAIGRKVPKSGYKPYRGPNPYGRTP